MISRAQTRNAFLVLMVLSAHPSAALASSNLRLCNNDTDRRDYLVAVVAREAFFMGIRWRASGWYHIEPNECVDFNNTDRVAELFLSIRREQDDGEYAVTYYGWDPAPNWPKPGGATYGDESFFCVSEDPFERVSENIDDLKSCWPFHYLQLFNLYVTIQSPTTYTLNLGR